MKRRQELRQPRFADAVVRGRVFDNIFVERLWRTVKYEDIYLKDYADVPMLLGGLGGYFDFYSQERPHQSLGYRTPANMYLGAGAAKGRAK